MLKFYDDLIWYYTKYKYRLNPKRFKIILELHIDFISYHDIVILTECDIEKAVNSFLEQYSKLLMCFI